MIDRRLNDNNEIPIVIEVNHNWFFIGIAGEDAPVKSFAPKSNERIDPLTEFYDFIQEENWESNVTNRPFFVVEPTNISQKDRKALAEFFFTKFTIPLIAFQDRAQSFLYATGRHTALIVEINENELIATPMEGVKRFSKAIVIKEGEGGPESDHRSITGIIYESIMKCPEDTRPRFIENIFLCGEYADRPDLNEMILKELHLRIPGDLKKYIRVNQLTEKPYFGWIGGSMTASLRTFNKWLTEGEYFQGKYYEKYLKLILNGEIIDYIYDNKL